MCMISKIVEILLYYLTGRHHEVPTGIYNSRNSFILLNERRTGKPIQSTIVEILLYYLTPTP